ncbi:MAG: hypothetical protein R3E68_02220 [Burkholderiaceae bacterium]
MNTTRRLPLASLVVAGSLIVGQSPEAAAQASSVPDSFLCSKGPTELQVELRFPDASAGGGCQVVSRPPGAPEPLRVIWKARFDMDFCPRKIVEYTGKLGRLGWQCEPDGAAAVASPVRPVGASPADVAVAPPRSAQTDAPIRIEQVSTGTGAAVSPVADTAVKPAVGSRVSEALPKPSAVTRADNKQALVAMASPAQGQGTFFIDKTTELPVGRQAGDYDDWFYRWDIRRQALVFTLFNTRDSTKARSFSFTHPGLARAAAGPSNIVSLQDREDNRVIIVAWPGETSQFITVLDPLLEERPICEIETQGVTEADWGYGVEKARLYLSGVRNRIGADGSVGEFKQPCPYPR